MQFSDQSITEESLFALYRSQGYEDTRIALELALERITAKIATLSDTVTRKQLQDTKKLIEDEIQSSYGGLFAQMQAESLAVAMAVNAPYLLEFSTAKIPTETLDYLVNSKRDIMGYEFKELFKLTADSHARALRVTLASGVAQGMATKQIIRELNVKNESLTKHQLYSNIQTTIKDAREVTTYSTYKQLEDLGVIRGYKFNATLDSRTSQVCRDADHLKWMTTIDKVPLRPPLHFNCRSKLLPITTNEYSTGKRASMDGEIADMSYGQWFATKDAQFQLKTLGRTKYDAYKKGIYKVGGIADLKPKNSLSLDDIAGELGRNAKGENSIFIQQKIEKKLKSIDMARSDMIKNQGYTDETFEKYLLSDSERKLLKGDYSDFIKQYSLQEDNAKDIESIFIKKTSKDFRKVFNKFGHANEYSFSDSDDIAFLSSGTDITISKTVDYRVFKHEYGHFVDATMGNRSMKKDFIEAFYEDSKLKQNGFYYDTDDFDNWLSSTLHDASRTEKFSDFSSGQVSDIIDAMHSGKPSSGGGLFGFSGHGEEYYAGEHGESLKMAESFAELFEMKDTEDYDKLKEYFPNMVKVFDKIYDEEILK